MRITIWHFRRWTLYRSSGMNGLRVSEPYQWPKKTMKNTPILYDVIFLRNFHYDTRKLCNICLPVPVTYFHRLEQLDEEDKDSNAHSFSGPDEDLLLILGISISMRCFIGRLENFWWEPVSEHCLRTSYLTTS